jgi:hypothetical protein
VQYAVIEGLGKVWSWQVVPRVRGDFSNDGEASATERSIGDLTHDRNIVLAITAFNVMRIQHLCNLWNPAVGTM